VETHTLLSGAWGVGRSLRDLELRTVTGASVIALLQEGRVHSSPDPDLVLCEKDTVVLLGSAEQLALACHMLDQGPEGSPVRNHPSSPPDPAALLRMPSTLREPTGSPSSAPSRRPWREAVG